MHDRVHVSGQEVVRILSGTLMTCPMPFHGAARSPLYRRQISSPCMSRMSRGQNTHLNQARRHKMHKVPSKSTVKCHLDLFVKPHFSLEFGLHLKGVAYYQLDDKTDKYLSLFWEAWSKQSSFYSDPSPIWLLCCLESVGGNRIKQNYNIERGTHQQYKVHTTVVNNAINNCSASFSKGLENDCSRSPFRTNQYAQYIRTLCWNPPETLWVSCHSRPPASPGDQRCSGTDRRLRSAAAHVAAPRPHRASPSPPGLQTGFPAVKRSTPVESQAEFRATDISLIFYILKWRSGEAAWVLMYSESKQFFQL